MTFAHDADTVALYNFIEQAGLIFGVSCIEAV